MIPAATTNIDEAAQAVTADQLKLIQAIFNVSRNGHPSTLEMVVNARPLIEAGLIDLEGDSDLSVPSDVQQALVRNGRALRVR